MFMETTDLTIPVEVMLFSLPAGGLGSVLSVFIWITRKETGMYVYLVHIVINSLYPKGNGLT